MRYVIHGNGLLNKIHIHLYASIVDFLVEMILIPDVLWYWKLDQSLLYLYFCLHITLVICFELLPFIDFISGWVTSATTIYFFWSAWKTKISYQVVTFRQLLFLKSQHCTYTFQSKRKHHIRRPNHGACR